jgi:hypothetical protein
VASLTERLRCSPWEPVGPLSLKSTKRSLNKHKGSRAAYSLQSVRSLRYRSARPFTPCASLSSWQFPPSSSSAAQLHISRCAGPTKRSPAPARPAGVQVPTHPSLGSAGAPFSMSPSSCYHQTSAWQHRTRARVRPNPSLERTSTGLALGPRTVQCHHPFRGPSANPAGSAQLKR